MLNNNVWCRVRENTLGHKRRFRRTVALFRWKPRALGSELFCSNLKSLLDMEKAEQLNADTVEGCRVTYSL